MERKTLMLLTVTALLAGAALACRLPLPGRIPTTEAPRELPTATPTPSGPCVIVASGTVSAYSRPSVASGVFGTMQAGESYPVEAKTADGWFGFEPGVAQAANTGLFRLRWVQEGTSGLTIEGDCSSVPVVVGPAAGVCYLMPMGSTPVYESPDVSSPVLATLELNDYVAVIARSTAWARVDLGQGNTGLEGLGWVEESAFNFNGPCDALPEAEGAVATATPGPLRASPRAGGLTCRYGPGMEYAPGGGLRAGVWADVVGRSASGRWVAIALPANPRLKCWLPVDSVNLTGDLMMAAVLPAPAAYVSRVTVVMSPPEASVPCGMFPYTFSVRFEIEVTGPTTVTFRRSRSNGDVAPAETVTFDAYGVQAFDDIYRVGSVGEKWFQVEVLFPNPVVAQGKAVMHCTP